VGYSLGVVGVLMVLVQAVLLRMVLPRLGARRAGTLGLLVTIVSFCGYALATDGWMIYLFVCVGALQGFATPAMQGIMSVNVPANEQGELQGGLASMASLTAILSPPFMTQLFAHFTAAGGPVYFPGAPFVAAAVLTGLALIVFLRATARLDEPEPADAASA
jgi:DHA1 family tetracycline resistance protein-like MFS transporter